MRKFAATPASRSPVALCGSTRRYIVMCPGTSLVEGALPSTVKLDVYCLPLRAAMCVWHPLLLHEKPPRVRPRRWTIQPWRGPCARQAMWWYLIRATCWKGRHPVTMAPGRWAWDVAPSRPASKHNNIMPNVSLRSSDDHRHPPPPVTPPCGALPIMCMAILFYNTSAEPHRS